MQDSDNPEKPINKLSETEDNASNTTSGAESNVPQQETAASDEALNSDAQQETSPTKDAPTSTGSDDSTSSAGAPSDNTAASDTSSDNTLSETSAAQEKSSNTVSDSQRVKAATASPSVTKATAQPSPTKPKSTTRSNSILMAMLWLMVIGLCGLSYWFYLQTVTLTEAVDDLTLGQKTLLNTSQQSAQVVSSLDQNQQSSVSTLVQLEKQLSTQKQQLGYVSDQLSSLTGIRRQDWEIARLEYLLKLASQRLQLDGDLAGARATLVVADEYLRLLDDPNLLPVRRQVSKDLLLLNASQVTDRTKLYLDLDSLIQKIPELQKNKPEFEIVQTEQQPPQDNFLDWVQFKLNGLVRLTSSDVKPAAGWLDEETRGQFNSMLIMRLMHAQQALMSENQTVYNASLQQAKTLVEQVYHGRPNTAVFLQEISRLETAQVMMEEVDISGSHQVLKTYLENVQQNMKDAVLRNLMKIETSSKQQGNK